MSTVRETVRAILNALAANLDEEEVKSAVRGWIGMKDAEEFLAANPGLRFTNEGVDPCGSVIPSGGGAALCATASGFDTTASGGGAALCHTPNASGRYSLYSGIPDVDPEVSAAAEALAGLAVTSSSAE
jgi:hypothetical protein